MISYDGRRFRPVGAERGESDRTAVYQQAGNLVWGEFAGGDARRGALTGTCDPDGILDFAYCVVLRTGEVVSGHCTSTPRLLDDGRIQLDEVWERYGAHASTGVSRLEEIRENAGVRTA